MKQISTALEEKLYIAAKQVKKQAAKEGDLFSYTIATAVIDTVIRSWASKAKEAQC